MTKFAGCTVVVEDCNITAGELEEKLIQLLPTPFVSGVIVTGAYYPKQRIIHAPSAEHAKQIIAALHKLEEK